MISFIQSELSSKEVQNIIGLYLHQIGFPKRWILLTDYCLDAPDKSNVISFVLLHYKNEREHADLEQKILRLQKSDIKHTRYISNRLMRYLKKLPVFSFSFILNKRNILFGDTVKEQHLLSQRAQEADDHTRHQGTRRNIIEGRDRNRHDQIPDCGAPYIME